MAKTAIGMMRCQCCVNDVVVKKNERGTLSYSCQFCDDAPYQKPGTLAFKSWESRIRPMIGAEPEKAEPERPATQPMAKMLEREKLENKKPAKSAGTLLG